MRILVATDHFPPHIGGAQIQSRTLAQELKRRGHDVAVAAVWQNGIGPVEDDDGVPVHRLRQLRTLPGLARDRAQHHQPPFPDPVTAVQLRRLIGRFRPDIVHSYGWISYSCAAALLGLDTPMIITSRDYAYGCPKRTLMYDGAECSGPALVKCLGCAGRHYGRARGWTAAVGVLGSRPLLRRKTSAIHSISGYVQAMVRRDFLDDRQYAADGDRNRVIHDVVGNAPSSFGTGDSSESVPARLAELPDEPFMLFVGALRRVKGIVELLAAYESLAEAPPLVLIGTMEPDTPPRFPPGVRVLSDFPHAAVMAAWERCLFGVLPSLWAEPFGTVVCEAMSRGKPVVATRPGGHTDMVVDGETGLLVDRGDVPALAEAMRFLIENPDERERLGRAARERSRQFTVDVSLPRIERLYEQTIRRHRSPVGTRGAA